MGWFFHLLSQSELMKQINRHCGKIRVERIEHQFDYSQAFDYISAFYVKQSSKIAGGFVMWFGLITFLS
jgi:hypothetical protein